MTSCEYEEFLAHLCRRLARELPVDVSLHRTYKGSSGQSYIIDVALEFTVMGVRYVTLIEAKYYKSTVDVGEILEFSAKIDDIGAHKGIMITTRGFQIGAQVVAASKRIALLVASPNVFNLPKVILEKPTDKAQDDIDFDDTESLVRDIRQFVESP